MSYNFQDNFANFIIKQDIIPNMKYTFKALKMYISKATFQLKIGQTIPEKKNNYRK